MNLKRQDTAANHINCQDEARQNRNIFRRVVSSNLLDFRKRSFGKENSIHGYLHDFVISGSKRRLSAVEKKPD